MRSTESRTLLATVRVVLPVGVAVAVGVFLTVASHALDWSDTTTLVVGGAMAALLGLFGVPLVLLPIASDGREVLPTPTPAEAHASLHSENVDNDFVGSDARMRSTLASDLAA